MGGYRMLVRLLLFCQLPAIQIENIKILFVLQKYIYTYKIDPNALKLEEKNANSTQGKE